MKNLVLFIFILVSHLSIAQGFKDRVIGKQWILTSPKPDSATVLNFEAFNPALLDINTMIWKFIPNGKLEYDYQSNSDVEACLGVDFLDLDLDYTNWKWNTTTKTLILTLKGGYAGIDDFIMKNEYNVHFHFVENQMTGFSLLLAKPISFKILNSEYARP